MVARDREAGESGVSKRTGRQAYRRVITLRRFVCPFLFLFCRRLPVPRFFLYFWRLHCVRSFVLHVIHRGVDTRCTA